ncbi:thioredoxin family protein [Paenibacillus thermotolerans]|uniref:thioredoxin family protein n=1 Tax=Paenibacillus thermotolerans TaxID=3027807 RepID=UPI002368EEA5|nr:MULTISPECIES: thioredoxin family protein [unclassified Paenibacillus]
MTLQSITQQQYRERLNMSGVSVIEFGAVWCPPCKQLSPLLHELAGEYGPAVSFAQVDVDESPELASELGIMGMPTVIVYRDGQPMDRLVGLRPKDAYRTVIQRTLQQ